MEANNSCSMICDRVYHLPSLTPPWTIRMTQEIEAKVTHIGDLESEGSIAGDTKSSSTRVQQRQSHRDEDDKIIVFRSMHVTPGNGANTSKIREPGRKDLSTVWTCCQCKSSNMTAMAPERCPICGHGRCSSCYDVPFTSSKRIPKVSYS